MAKSERLELGDNTLRTLYGSIFDHCDVLGQQSNLIRRKKAITPFKVIQGHSRSSRSVSIESPYATSYISD